MAITPRLYHKLWWIELSGTCVGENELVNIICRPRQEMDLIEEATLTRKKGTLDPFNGNKH